MMGWMMDEYSKLTGVYTPSVFTGKPVGGGGSLGRTEATGFGVIYTVREAMKYLKMDPTKCVAAIEGFGNVAQYASIGFVEMLGGKVACVSCWDRNDKKSYTYSHKDGVDGRFLLSIVDQYGTIDRKKAEAAGYLVEDGGAWITKEADVVFKQNKIFIIPDFLCNSGGVTTSYFEGVQNDMNFYWSKQEVLERLDAKVTSAFNDVLHMAEKQNVYMRDAAYMVSIQRVVDAMKIRGWLHGDW